MRRIVLALAVWLALAGVARADPFKPNEDFKTLNTEHFHITYPADRRFEAQKAAVLAEEVFALLTKRYKWTPHTPIEMLLTDRTDYANANTSIAPMQLINVYLAQPHTSDRLDYYDDWIRMLIVHEMTHAVNLDAVSGLPQLWRWVFGRVLPVGDIQPLGLIEGTATLQESMLTTKGRVRDVNSLMLLRMAALEDRWPAIDRTTVPPAIYPTWYAPFIWGAMFNKYLYDHFGMDALADANLLHAGDVWPFLFNHNANKVYGSHLTDLYEAWSVDMKRWAAAEGERLAAAGLTRAVAVTDNGWDHINPRWADENTLVYSESNRDRGATLRRLDLRGKTPSDWQLTETFDEARGLDIAPDGAILYTDTLPKDPWRFFYDLYRFEPGAVLPRRLTTDLRVTDPAIIPGTNLALCITQTGGRSRLSEVNIRTGAVRHLTKLDQYGGYIQMSGLAVHPSGTWAAVSIWHDDGNRDLFKFDLATGKFTRLTADPERDFDPAFDPSGRYLVFSSARTGIFNIYALDLETDELFRVTNVLGGAFMPAVSPSGRRLAFVGYRSTGYDIYLMDFRRENWVQVPRETIDNPGIVIGPISRSIDDRARLIDPPTDDYDSAQNAWPHYWFPDWSPTFIIGGSDILLGAETAGFDVAQRHAWDTHFLWAFKRRFPYADAEYTYERYNPSVNIAVAHVAENHGPVLTKPNGQPFDYWERRLGADLTADYAILWRHEVYAGYTGEWRSDLDRLPAGTRPPPLVGYWSGARIGWRYAANDVLDRRVVFPASLGATFYDPAFGSVVRQQLVGGTAEAYVPLPVYRGSFIASAAGGVSFGRQLPQRTFFLGGTTQADPVLLNFANDQFAMPGYNSGIAYGDAAATGTVAFNFPIVEIERGLWTWPIYFRDFYGQAFADGGFAIDRGQKLTRDDLFPDAGLTITMAFVLGYSLESTISGTFAYGLRDLDNMGGPHWLVNLGGLLP